MNIYGKLAEAREEFHKLKLKKTGRNNFAGYTYFELADFLVPAMQCLKNHGLMPVVSFAADSAEMNVYETDGDGFIRITSPMADANLKGCHPIQNLGAVETYNRRYLWVSLMEIVEHDSLDSSPPIEAEPSASKIKQATPRQRAALKQFKDSGIMPNRRKSWLEKEDNWKSLTEAHAETILNECRDLQKERAA